uniref:metallophosphoesterase family protein n=1 Tax=Ndongobacter massiliensis TaxID=1871025 RepID=UPI000930B33F|nr:DNA repair exonuclease [Ndongobacter massiliensis]
MTWKVFHAADLHLGAPLQALGTYASERSREKIQTVRRMLTFCEEEGVDILLLAGDIFDNVTIPPALLQEVQEMFGVLTKTKVFISPGNHDYFAIDSPYAQPHWPDCVHIFRGKASTVLLPAQQISITGAGFEGTYQRESLLCDFDPMCGFGSIQNFGENRTEKSEVPDSSSFLHLAVLHGDLVRPGEKSNYHPIVPEAFPADYFAYVALGHVHKRTPIQNIGKTAYAYAGCLDGAGFDETGAKGGYLLTWDGRQMQSQFLSFSSRQFHREEIDVSEVQSREELSARIEARVQQFEMDAAQTTDGVEPEAGVDTSLRTRDVQADYYRFYLIGNCEESLARRVPMLEQELRDRLYYVELFDETQPAVNWASVRKEQNLRGFFVDALQKKIAAPGDEREKEVQQLALRYGWQALEGDIRL